MSTVTVTAESFSETVKSGIVVLDWWASWCGPCRAFAPVFEKASSDHPDIVFGKVNADEESELSGGFGIQAIPTLMIFRDGILLFNQAGMLDADQLNQLLNRARTLDMETVRRQVANDAKKVEPSKGS